MDHNFFLYSFTNTFAYSLYCVNINPTYLQCAKLVRKISSEVRIPVMIREKIEKIHNVCWKNQVQSESIISIRYKAIVFPVGNPLWFIYVISKITTQEKHVELLIDFSFINQCIRTGVEVICMVYKLVSFIYSI